MECPSCGAPLPSTRAWTKMVVCEYCGQTSFLNADSLEMAGEKVILRDYDSLLHVGASGFIKGKHFQCMGMMRFDYGDGDGFWDEWLIELDEKPGQPYWLQEDEGRFTLLYETPSQEQLPPFEQMPVGGVLTLDGRRIFIAEKSKGVVNGGEGILPWKIVPGEQCDFVDGIFDGKTVSIEYLPDGVEVYMGTPIAVNEIKID